MTGAIRRSRGRCGFRAAGLGLNVSALRIPRGQVRVVCASAFLGKIVLVYRMVAGNFFFSNRLRLMFKVKIV